MNPAMTTTAFELDGYRIVKNFGVVRGIIVRSRSIFGTIGAGLQTLVGGNITILTDLCEKTRQHALELCVQHAQQVGANAIIGLRYDATEIMQGVTEVLLTEPRSRSSPSNELLRGSIFLPAAYLAGSPRRQRRHRRRQSDPGAIDDYLRHDGHGSLRHANDRTGRGGLRDRAYHSAHSKRRGQLAAYRARPV